MYDPAFLILIAEDRMSMNDVLVLGFFISDEHKRPVVYRRSLLGEGIDKIAEGTCNRAALKDLSLI
jgi:hypothetical protein